MKESVIEIAETLFYEKIHDSGEPFFANAAKDLFTAILLHFYRSENPEKNNYALKAFLDGSPIDIIREILGKYDDLRAMETYIVGGGAQAVGVFSELQQLSRKTFLSNFAKFVNLSMCELVRQKGGRTVTFS